MGYIITYGNSEGYIKEFISSYEEVVGLFLERIKDINSIKVKHLPISYIEVTNEVNPHLSCIFRTKESMEYTGVV